MSAINVDSLLTPLSPATPCGEDLEYNDPLFSEMEQAAKGTPERQYGATVIPAQEPDWQTVKRKALELLARTRDLRVAVYLTQALVQTEGLDGLRDGLALLCGLVERYWDSVHPQLDPKDDYDPTLRVNTLAALDDPQTMLRRLRALPLVESPTLGRFNLRDIEIALGKLAPVSTDDKVPPLDMALIEGAFMDCPLERLQHTAGAIAHCLEQTTQIETLTAARVGVDQAPDLGGLTHLLKEAHQILTERLARRSASSVPPEPAALEQQADSADATLAAPAGQSHSPPAVRPVLAEITSREEAARLLDKLCEYFRRYEPSSPVPLLLKRAQRLMYKDFMEILQDLAPAGVAQAELIRGADSEQPAR